MLVPPERTMHLRELRAWRRLKESSEPAPRTTPWMRIPTVLVMVLEAYYQPCGFIGMVVPTQDGSIDDPHFSKKFPDIVKVVFN